MKKVILMCALNQRGQSSFEALMIAGVAIAFSAMLGSYYLGSVADQTTAIIILKTELLKELNTLEKTYTITSSLEPTLKTDGTLCFNVTTNPIDLTNLQNLDEIKNKIAQNTKYKDTAKIEINLNSGACT